VAAILKTDMMS